MTAEIDSLKAARLANFKATYVAGLRAEVAAIEARRAEQGRADQEAAAQAARERLTPLEARLRKLLATIPDAVQKEGLSLSSLQTSLRGRWRGSCHPGELGEALRKLGFARKRRWHGEGGFRAVWRRP